MRLGDVGKNAQDVSVLKLGSGISSVGSSRFARQYERKTDWAARAREPFETGTTLSDLAMCALEQVTSDNISSLRGYGRGIAADISA